MIEKFQDWLIPKVGSGKAYYATIVLYTSIMLIILGLNGWLFDNWSMVIIASIIMNVIRNYTSGFHCHSLLNCIFLTNGLIILFGYISKQSVDNLWIVFLLGSLYIIKDIYLYAPLEDTDYKDKSILWHKKKAIQFVILFIVAAISLVQFGYIHIAKDILLSIIMVDVLLFKNQERV